MLGRFILKVFAVDFEFIQFLGKALFKISFNSFNLSSVSEKRFHLTPSNNFAENTRKFPGTFHRKIRWKCRQLFPGISRNPFRGTRSEEFLVTHSEEILVTLSKEFLVANSREFLVTYSSEKLEKICCEKVFRTNSIPKIFSRVPQEYLEIFTNKSSE